jgi:hypothetical protein
MTSPDELLELVARAIASEDGGPGHPLGTFPGGSPMRDASWDDFMPQQQDAWRRMAQVAIAMVQAGSPVDGGWKPIETAPKDGEPILLTVANAYTPTTFLAWWLDAREGEGFYTYTLPGEKQDVGGFHRMVCPTHWQPLPAPPPSSGEV